MSNSVQNSYIDVGYCKDIIIKDLFGNQSIVDALDSQSSNFIIDEPSTLIYNNIFPYFHIPDAQTKADTYILLDVDVTNINSINSSFSDVRIMIRVLAHQNRMKYIGEKGTRIDVVANKIIEVFDGSMKYGFGRLKILSNIGDILNENYHYRDLTFITYDLNMFSGKRAGLLK